jgi:hypothetical protein
MDQRSTETTVAVATSDSAMAARRAQGLSASRGAPIEIATAGPNLVRSTMMARAMGMIARLDTFESSAAVTAAAAASKLNRSIRWASLQSAQTETKRKSARLRSEVASAPCASSAGLKTYSVSERRAPREPNSSRDHA